MILNQLVFYSKLVYRWTVEHYVYIALLGNTQYDMKGPTLFKIPSHIPILSGLNQSIFSVFLPII